jgi:2-methyl-3-hydroxypyridine 5-carboxylic acid dioxygenase
MVQNGGSQMTRHAEIAGAGFAGLVAGIALAHRGWTVRIHEASPELRTLGAGIFIWENGLRVLAAVGPYHDVVAGAHNARIYETRVGDRVVGEKKFEAGEHGRMLTMTRQHLYDCILRCAREEGGIEILTNSEVIGGSPDGVLLTADGRSWKADLVVGADGVRSKVRDSLNIRTRRTTGTDGIIRVLGPRRYQQLGAGNWNRVIDFWSDCGRRLRILYVPCNQDVLYLSMMAPIADQEASAIPIQRDVWISAFPQLAPVLTNIVAGGRHDPYETTRTERWSLGRVALIGDAAHAMIPTLGQGAGVAMMNALSLAVSVSASQDLETALASWEERERPITDHTQDRSEQVALQRLMQTGYAWDEASLRTAKHRPTGTEDLPQRLDA